MIVYISCLDVIVFITCASNYEVWRMRKQTVKEKIEGVGDVQGKRKNGMIDRAGHAHI